MFFTGDCSCSSPNSLLSELKISSPLSLSLSQLKTPNLNGFVGILFKFGWELCLYYWYGWEIELSLFDFVGILFMYICGLIFFLYNIHLWFFWVRLSCVLVFDFLGLYDFFGFVFLCVLDEEDVRYLIMCCWFLIIFFHFFYFVKIDKLIFKILS